MDRSKSVKKDSKEIGSSTYEEKKSNILDFFLVEGQNQNEFYQHDKIATHTILTSGIKPRLIVSFPAGNSAVSLWFDKTVNDSSWSKAVNKSELSETDSKGNRLYGIQWDTQLTTSKLSVEKAVLGNIRIVRDYLHLHKVPDSIFNERTIKNDSVTWYRLRLDGKSAYKLQVKILNGTVNEVDDKIVFSNITSQPLKFTISALSGDTPLTPIKHCELLLDNAVNDPMSKKVLAFLTYKEKMLAGSWRFLTYFGRDTLLTVRLLMPVLHPNTIESALSSVIERINANGEVAHEEDISDFAALRSLKEHGKVSVEPLFDYTMRDDNFMFTAIISEYLLNSNLTETQIEKFLARKTSNGISYGEKIASNMRYVYKVAVPFAKTPQYNHLIALIDGSFVGDWRDSQEGLGFGKYSYSVNAVLVPAALKAIDDFINSGTLANYITNSDFNNIQKVTKVWEINAPKLFEYELNAGEANIKLDDYAASQGVPVAEELYWSNDDVAQFYALSLTEKGLPLPIMQSDFGFSLLLQNPSDEQILRMLDITMKPFPAGLISPVGLFISNAVFATKEKQKLFSRERYHGAVVWHWQQALLLSGLNKQLKRKDLLTVTMANLAKAKTTLLKAIKGTKDNQANRVKSTELWTWEYENNSYLIKPFGQNAEHQTESNAAQLWSTVDLALPESY